MVNLQFKNETFFLTFKREDIIPELLNRLLTFASIEDNIQNSELTEEQVLELSNDAKSAWWAKNQDWVMGKIDKNENNN
jgi:hypothetical protein